VLALERRGMTFTNFTVSDSLCCPSRSTIFTGDFPHNTHVVSNSPPLGGFDKFTAEGDDKSTFATSLSSVGYRTALIGKYLNGYNSRHAAFVPAGWDVWRGMLFKDEGGYYNYGESQNGVEVKYGSDPADYSTDVLAQQSEDFITSTPSSQPLFLWFAPHAPHDPATPPPRYANACPGYQPPRSPNVGAIGPDEPAWVQALGWSKGAQTKSDALMLNRCRSLLAVDDAVGGIVQTLQDTGRLSNTLIVFASDNGWSAGSHRWSSKRVPWNESLRVPLIMRWDGHITPGSHVPGLVVNVDWTETFADAAGVTLPTDVQGQSLLPLLNGQQYARSDFLTEAYSHDWTPTSGGMPNYCGVRSLSWLYVKYQTGEEEMYDEQADPYELHNLVNDPDHASQLDALRARMRQLCDPPPPGFTP
jgi:arylsulfatase A-like enzyme